MIFQIGSALLDACVLAALSKGDTYGYELSQRVINVINISESTLYPVLRRLQKDGCLSTYDKPFSGRNRRYYKITDKGNELLDGYIEEWENYKLSIDSLLGGNEQ